MKIRIEHCSLGLTRIEWGLIYRQQNTPTGHEFTIGPILNQTVEDARNLALSMALRDGVDILFFYDDDMLPRGRAGIPTLVDTLNANPDAAVISGVYPMRGDLPVPLVFKDRLEGSWPGWKDGRVHEIYCAGTGFTAFNMRELVENVELPETYSVPGIQAPVHRFIVNNKNVTDDFALAECLRDNKKKWLVHGGVLCDQINKDGKVFSVEQYDYLTQVVQG